MVRLNKNSLTNKQLENLFSQFSQTISPENPKNSNLVLAEILGFEERIMIAKRLAAILLLVEGISMYKVSKLLKLSRSTVESLLRKIENGEYDYTLKRISKTKNDYFSFLETLDNILHLGGILPHYNGLDRYKYLK